MIKFLIRLFSKGKLKIVEPSEEIKNSYFEKSKSNLISSKILLENNRLEEAVALTYYSMYNLVLALLFKIGINQVGLKECENHSATAILLKEIFGLENSVLIKAKKERIDKQYYTDFSITKKEVEEGIISAENFNRDLRGFISGLSNQKINDYKNKFEELLRNE